MAGDLQRALTEGLAAAAHAVADENGYERWKGVRAVLDTFYRAEEKARSLDPTYYARRDASGDGQALGGLIWLRGIEVHHQAETEELRPGPTYWTGTEAKPLSLYVWTGTKAEPLRAHMVTAYGSSIPLYEALVWPDRDSLPPGKPERHGRDVMYDRFVARHELMLPLERARSFLRGESL